MFFTIFKYFIILWILVGIYNFLIVPYLNKKLKKKKEHIQMFADAFGEALSESMEETQKMRSNELPSDEDILLYYKMYCKKWELDNRDVWTTREPMSFDQWERDVKDVDDSLRYHGWKYMISQTSDAFISDADGHSFIRHNNYKRMVENDDEQFIHDIEEAAEEKEMEI